LHKKGGTLEADNTVLTIQAQLLSVFNTQASISGNAYSYLAEIGLSLQSNGTLSLNSADFKSALSSDMNSVVNLFTHSTQGFMQRFYSETTTLLQADGVVDAKNDGLGTRISDIDIRINQMETRLTSTERRLRKQFASLDALLGTLSSTTNLLLRQLG
jgi:flagellar hook-associated protein 2